MQRDSTSAIVDLSDFAACLKIGEPEIMPQSKPVLIAHGANGFFKVLDCQSNVKSFGGETHGPGLVSVSVCFNQASLQHPVKKFVETFKVCFRLVLVGYHAVRFAAKAAKTNAMVSTKNCSIAAGKFR
jgi:hypothetical protein